VSQVVSIKHLQNIFMVWTVSTSSDAHLPRCNHFLLLAYKNK